MIILKPSTIEGVGCFTTEDIHVGEIIDAWKDGDYRDIMKSDLRPENEWKVKTWCVEKSDRYVCPLDFRAMSVGWYMNHSDTPNAEWSDAHDEYVATRDIVSGEEITIDYKRLDTIVDNSIN